MTENMHNSMAFSFKQVCTL